MAGVAKWMQPLYKQEKYEKKPTELLTGVERQIRLEEEALTELIRFHNTSIPYRKGRVITATFLYKTEKYALVDTGFKQAVRVKLNEISAANLVESADKYKVRTDPSDLVYGDKVIVQVEELETPFGDMWVSGARGEQELRSMQVLEELSEAHQQKRPVMGRILNSVTSGFSVGIGGLVAFCPSNAISHANTKKVGMLQPFYIQRIDGKTRFVVLSDRPSRDDMGEDSDNAGRREGADGQAAMQYLLDE